MDIYLPQNYPRSVYQRGPDQRWTGSTHPDLVRTASFRQVPHPFYTLIATLLKDLQEPHDQPRSREHQDLEVHIDRRPRPHLFRRCGCQSGVGRKRHFGSALHSWDSMEKRSRSQRDSRRGAAEDLTSRQSCFLQGRIWPCRWEPCTRRWWCSKGWVS